MTQQTHPELVDEVARHLTPSAWSDSTLNEQVIAKARAGLVIPLIQAQVLRDMYALARKEQMVSGCITRADYSKEFIEDYAKQHGIDL